MIVPCNSALKTEQKNQVFKYLRGMKTLSFCLTVSPFFLTRSSMYVSSLMLTELNRREAMLEPNTTFLWCIIVVLLTYLQIYQNKFWYKNSKTAQVLTLTYINLIQYEQHDKKLFYRVIHKVYCICIGSLRVIDGKKGGRSKGDDDVLRLH